MLWWLVWTGCGVLPAGPEVVEGPTAVERFAAASACEAPSDVVLQVGRTAWGAPLTAASPPRDPRLGPAQIVAVTGGRIAVRHDVHDAVQWALYEPSVGRVAVAEDLRRDSLVTPDGAWIVPTKGPATRLDPAAVSGAHLQAGPDRELFAWSQEVALRLRAARDVEIPSPQGRAVRTGEDGRVSVVDGSEAEVWSTSLTAGTRAVLTDDGTVVAATDGARLALFDASDGRRLDDPERDAPVPTVAAAGPAGQVIAAYDDGSLRSFRADGSLLGRWALNDVQQVVWAEDLLCARNAEGVWCFEPDGTLKAAPARRTMTPGARTVGFRVVQLVAGPAVIVDDRRISLPRAIGAPRDFSALPDGRTISVRGAAGSVLMDVATGTVLEERPPARLVQRAVGDELWVRPGRAPTAPPSAADSEVAAPVVRGAVVDPGDVAVDVAEPSVAVKWVFFDRGTLLASGEQAAIRFAADGRVRAAERAYPPNPKVLVKRTARGRWGIQEGRDRRLLEGLPDGEVGTAAPGGEVVAVADQRVVWIRHPDHDQVRGISLPRVSALALSADGQRLAVASPVAGLWVVQTATAQVLHVLAPPEVVRLEPSLAWSGDGRFLAMGSRDVWAFDVDTGLSTVHRRYQGAATLAVSLDGRHVAAHTHDGQVQLVDLSTGTVHAVQGDFGEPDALWFDDDTLRVARGSGGARIGLDGSVLASTLWPWDDEVRGLQLADDGAVRVLGSGHWYTLSAATGVARWEGLATVTPGAQGRAWFRFPGLDAPRGAPAMECAQTFAGGLGCPVDQGDELPAMRRPLPSPTGAAVVDEARVGKSEATIHRVGTSPVALPETERDPSTLAWAGQDSLVALGPGLELSGRVGSLRARSSLIGGGVRGVAAGGPLRARLGDALLVTEEGSDEPRCVFDGGSGPIVMSPSGGHVAWTDGAGGVRTAIVESCVRAPDVARVSAAAPASRLGRTGRIALAHTTVQGSVVGESPSRSRVVVSEPPLHGAEVWDASTGRSVGALGVVQPPVAVTDAGLAAWITRTGHLVWRPPGGGTTQRVSDLVGVQGVAAHPAGHLVVYALGRLEVITPTMLAQRSEAVAPRTGSRRRR
ncbi:MAG: hypothetical protein KTR31_16040 [Myxococcales bacterium]|nr:hypothetical protein [Myxococcales bacterium]